MRCVATPLGLCTDRPSLQGSIVALHSQSLRSSSARGADQKPGGVRHRCRLRKFRSSARLDGDWAQLALCMSGHLTTIKNRLRHLDAGAILPDHVENLQGLDIIWGSSMPPSARFKYGDELVKHPDCPPTTLCKCVTRRAFRFVHEDIKDSRNFLPPARVNPKRLFKPDERCDALALSMFCDEEKAVRFYDNLRKICKNIRNAIGSHLAGGQLKEADGMTTIDGEDGHFSLFESSAVDWEGRFEIVKVLYEAA